MNVLANNWIWLALVAGALLLFGRRRRRHSHRHAEYRGSDGGYRDAERSDSRFASNQGPAGSAPNPELSSLHRGDPLRRHPRHGC